MAGRGRTEGRRECRLDRGEVRLACPAPGRAVPSRETPQVERREACVPVTRHAGAFAKVPGVDLAPSALRALTPVREGKMTALPAADPTTGAMTHVCSNVWVCTRLFHNRI